MAAKSMCGTAVPMRTSLMSAKRATRAVRAAAQAEAKPRLSPLEKGGTLTGDAALGKDASAVTKASAKASGTFCSMKDGRFVDDRWVNGTWDFEQFKNAEGEVDYDKVTPC